jgi:hypothetical protein
MALELQGKLVQINPEQTGTGKNGTWVRQEMIIETAEQFPKKVCISCWGDKVEQIKNLKPGTDIKVAVNAESREYNGKWYTDLRAWKIDANGSSAGNSNSGNNYQQQQQQPAYNQAQPIPSQPANDDLPF